MRWLVILKLAAVLMATGLFVVTANAKCDPSELQITVAVESGSQPQEQNRAVNQIRTLVDQDLQGRACLQLIVGEERFREKGVLGALRSRTVLMALPQLEQLAGDFPRYGIFGLPFAFWDFRAVERFMASKSMPELSGDLSSNGLHGIGILHGGFDQLATRKMVLNPDDALGIKLDVTNNPGLEALAAAVRGIAKQPRAGELGAALQSGDVDGVATDWLRFVRLGLKENLSFITQTNHRYRGYQMITRKEWWDGLDESLRKDLQQSLTRGLRQANFGVVQQQRLSRNRILRGDAAAFALSRTQWSRWRAAVQPIWDQFSETAGAGLLPDLEAANRLP